MRLTRHLGCSALGLALAVGLATAAPADERGASTDGTLAAMLDRARAQIAAGAFTQAQASVDAVLQAAPGSRVRATALTLAGDAAYGIGAYRTAAAHYGAALQANQPDAEAAHAGAVRDDAHVVRHKRPPLTGTGRRRLRNEMLPFLRSQRRVP